MIDKKVKLIRTCTGNCTGTALETPRRKKPEHAGGAPHLLEDDAEAHVVLHYVPVCPEDGEEVGHQLRAEGVDRHRAEDEDEECAEDLGGEDDYHPRNPDFPATPRRRVDGALGRRDVHYDVEGEVQEDVLDAEDDLRRAFAQRIPRLRPAATGERIEAPVQDLHDGNPHHDNDTEPQDKWPLPRRQHARIVDL